MNQQSRQGFRFFHTQMQPGGIKVGIGEVAQAVN
jgi:hypothetical protein